LTLHDVRSSLREWTRRVWGAFGGRRTDHDLQRELAGHLALAEDELRRKGHAPRDAARLARAAAGGQSQAVEALREQRGLPWLGSSWLDVRLGLRLLVRNWGLTLVGGLATTLAIGIAAIVFAAFDVVMWSRLPLDEGDRVVAIQVWDREAGRRRDTTWQDVERWRATLHSVDDVGAFQTTRRNIITSDGSVELAAVAEISAAGFRVARVAPLVGRPIADADAAPGAAPVVVIGHDVWQRRFAGSRDVIGRELRLGGDVHTVVGVMPDGFQFPFNFRYWVPLRRTADGMLRNTGPEGVVFGRLAPGATLARAHAEVSALGILPLALGSAQREQGLALRSAEREGGKSEATGPRVVPYTFAFTGDFEPGDMSLLWSLSSLGLVLLLLPPCANIAILNYARTVSRQKEFAARYALGGSRARIIWQLFIEALVLTAAAAGVTLLVVQVVWVVVAGRLQNIPGGPPFWMTFGLSSRTLLFVAGLAVAGAAVSGLVPALQAGPPGAAGCRRARRTDQRAARRDVDHAGDRAGRLLGRRAAIGRRTRLGHASDRRHRPGLRCRGVCDRACRAGRRTARARRAGWEERRVTAGGQRAGSRAATARRALWQSRARVGATAPGRPGHPRRGGRPAAARRGAVGVRRHRGARHIDRSRRSQWPAAGIPRPIQPGRYRVL
jgi:hypothetical protein